MRFQWTRSPQPTEASAQHMPFVVQDLLKLFAYAIAVGIAFSALAVAVTLALSRNSEAQSRMFEHPSVEGNPSALLAGEVEVLADGGQPLHTDGASASDERDVSPTPGSLYIGDGCGSEELVATEREWYVRIDGAFADVQVMQTFVMPAGSEFVQTEDALLWREAGPWFHAVLPAGAQFTDLKIDTSRHRLVGRLIEPRESPLTEADLLEVAQRQAQTSGEIGVYARDWETTTVLSSDVLFDARADETIVVTYRYRVALDRVAGESLLSLVLDGASGDEGTDSQPVVDVDRIAPAGAVWLEWIHSAPSAVDRLPDGASIERNRGEIAGLAWATPRIAPNEKFVIGWR